jgi:hypothetical protein
MRKAKLIPETKPTEADKKPKLKIFTVTIKRILDESPDTSWLGEYSDTSTSDFSIDRAHSEDCASVSPVSDEGINILQRAIGHLEDSRTVCEEHIHVYQTLPRCEACETEQAEQRAIDTLTDAQDVPECDCNGGDMDRREYRYFNPSFNYVDKNGNPSDGLTAEEVRKYVRQDYERMESLNAGNWSFIGIKAEAEIGIPQSVPRPRTGQSYLLQTFHSGGLWGIESDSERSFMEEEEKNQLAELRDVLVTFGLSRRAISQAFQSVKRDN